MNGTTRPKKAIIDSKMSRIKTEIKHLIRLATENNQILITPTPMVKKEEKTVKSPSRGWLGDLIEFLDDVIEGHRIIHDQLSELNRELKTEEVKEEN